MRNNVSDNLIKEFRQTNRFGNLQHQGTLNKALRRIIRDCNDMQLSKAILDFINTNESYYVGIEKDEEAKKIAEGIMETGVKSMDALHVACAILAGSDYFITTDDRLLKYQTEKIQIVTPGEFIRRMEAVE